MMLTLVIFAAVAEMGSSHIQQTPPWLPNPANSRLVLAANPMPRQNAEGRRIVTSLDGEWDLADGNELPPESFPSKVQVPGLVDLAVPALPDDAQFYWHRKVFTLTESSQMTKLRLKKAMYETKILLNGQVLGVFENCFTPIELDVSSIVRPKGRKNVLYVRVGRLENLPANALTGSDYEKSLYTPGIYDSVEVLQFGQPAISWTQVRPLPGLGKVGVLAHLWHRKLTEVETPLAVEISDPSTGAVLASSTSSFVVPIKQGAAAYLEVPAGSLQLWSPENPKLYRLSIKTSGDEETVTFGQRSFAFDPTTKASLLNGNPYPLRGTNIAIHRFFEDKERRALPWSETWVRKVIRKFKSLGWNACRYTIGFPPEIWYKIADEEGLLIQDEFPIWRILDFPNEVEVGRLAAEYGQWMVDRWNHPCVVIWDAANETPGVWQTGYAASLVRGYDLSERPWEGGASEIPGDPNHPWESHAYIFLENSNYTLFDLNDRLNVPPPIMVGLPFIEPFTEGHPRFVNEFDWLWLNRDGTPTEFTQGLYDRLLGPGSSEGERRFLKAVHTASMIELFRINPYTSLTGVLQFCSLGYNRDQGRGITSDNWLPGLENAQMDPYFEKWVGDASQPIAAIIPQWWAGGPALPQGSVLQTPIWVKNDTGQPWMGQVTVKVFRGFPASSAAGWALISQTSVSVSAAPFGGIGRTTAQITLPATADRFFLSAEVTIAGRTNQTIREITVGPVQGPKPAPIRLRAPLGRPSDR